MSAYSQEKASELLRVYRSSPAAERTLVPFQELRGMAAHICPDETTLCLALLQLQREKQVTVAVHEGEKVRPLALSHYSPVQSGPVESSPGHRTNRVLLALH